MRSSNLKERFRASIFITSLMLGLSLISLAAAEDLSEKELWEVNPDFDSFKTK